MKLFNRNKDKDSVNIRQPRFKEQVQQEALFRRSRTLTGSKSSSVVAASEGQAQIKSARLEEHELRSKRRHLFISLVAAIIVLMALVWLISQFTWRISSVVSTDPTVASSSLSSDKYKQAVYEYFGNQPLERFRFILRQQSLSNYLQSNFPELAGASISSESGLLDGKLTLTLRKPIIGWKIDDSTYYVDNGGMAFTRNYYKKPNLTVIDNSGIQSDSGAIASDRALHFIGRTVTLVNKSTVGDVSKVTIPSGTTREVDFRLAGKSYYIKTQLDRDAAGQAADIVSAVKYIERHNIKIKYLDVRVSSKAFYR